MNLPFSINGADFSDCVAAGGYQTDRTPVYAPSRMTDLQGYDHEVVLRYRGSLSAPLHDLPEDRRKELGAALLTRPLYVTYYSFQLGQVVSERMRIDAAPAALLLEDAGERWLSSDALEFTAL